jgi:hypothetical protein
LKIFQLKQKINNHFLIALLWEIALILYIFRSAYPPLRIVAFGSIGLLVFLVLINFLFFKTEIKIASYFKINKEFIAVGLFFVFGIIMSTYTVKHTLNDLFKFVVVIVFAITYFSFFKDISWKRILNYWLYFSTGIGLIAIYKWATVLKGIDIQVLQISQGSIALVTDYNFYSLFFVF